LSVDETLGTFGLNDDISAVCLPGQSLKAALTYNIVVRSKSEVLIEHQDDVATIDFGYRWLGDSDIDRIVNAAKQIPSALRRDTHNARKAQPLDAANRP